MYHLKTIVLFFKIIACLVCSRSFGNILHDYTRKYEAVTTSTLRLFEKLHIKVKKANLDLIFLKNCQTFNVTPNFLCFDLPFTNAHDLKSIRKRLLRSNIHKRTKERNKLVLEVDQLSRQIRSIISSVDYYILWNAVRKNVDECERKTILTHEKKLRNLTKNSVLPFSKMMLLPIFPVTT